jgi:hypothetical protein
MKSNEPILSVHLGVRFSEQDYEAIIASRDGEKMNLTKPAAYVRYLAMYGLKESNKEKAELNRKLEEYDKTRTS